MLISDVLDPPLADHRLFEALPEPVDRSTLARDPAPLLGCIRAGTWDTHRVHLAYVDDSGDKHGTTLTALIVEDQHWAGLLEAWLEGRRKIHQNYGITKNHELHAVELMKGRGAFWNLDVETRAAIAETMARHLARFEHFDVITIGSSKVVGPTVYAEFIAWLEDWAAERDTRLMVFYDGQQGLIDDDQATVEDAREAWEKATRAAAPYRRAHRDLELGTRRIIEDVVMQDSRISQFIQAADLAAYGALQRHRQTHPEIWGTSTKPSAMAAKAYMKLSRHWPADSDAGVYWLG